MEKSKKVLLKGFVASIFSAIITAAVVYVVYILLAKNAGVKVDLPVWQLVGAISGIIFVAALVISVHKYSNEKVKEIASELTGREINTYFEAKLILEEQPKLQQALEKDREKRREELHIKELYEEERHRSDYKG